MIELGTKVRSNDPRDVGHIREVLEVGHARVLLSGPPKTWVLISRIHEDGKERRTGYNVVDER